jgi:MFS family permease
VAAQTPKERSGWALGVLSSGIMAGNVAGPLLGGTISALIGIRLTFLVAGAVIFVTFLATSALIREERVPAAKRAVRAHGGWSLVADKRVVVVMLATGFLLMVATMSIEPIITVYVAQFVAPSQVPLVAGVVMSAAALGTVVSAPRLGKLGDRIGHWNVVVGCLGVSALLLIPQAFVGAAWQLVVLRFLMGVALGGLLPSITSLIRHSVGEAATGKVLGYSISAQYAGQVLGPLAGGFVGGRVGMRAVFLGTCVVMAAGAVGNRAVQVRRKPG